MEQTLFAPDHLKILNVIAARIVRIQKPLFFQRDKRDAELDNFYRHLTVWKRAPKSRTPIVHGNNAWSDLFPNHPP
jgi:hypothetical protein